MPTEEPPDRDRLEQYLLGRLDDEQHERVEQWLSQAPDASARARETQLRDQLVDTLRGLAEQTPEAVVPADLLRKLEQLRPEPSGLNTPAHAREETATVARPAPPDFSFLAPPQRPDELGRLGGFRVLEKIGAGGMGLVLLAEDPKLCRQVALKVIRPEHALNADARERFLREARTVAALDHEHIVPLYQAGEENGVLFLAMPLLAGETLEDRLRRDGRLSAEEVQRIGRETAEGLAAAHAAGLIHRDIKPSNLWLRQLAPLLLPSPPGGEGNKRGSGAVTPPPQVKILDFGLARAANDADGLTQPGMIVGTPAYMAPEQVDGLAVDGRCDLFSLGCVLYRAATGQPAFSGPTYSATLRSVAEHQPPPPQRLRPELPTGLSDLIMRLLAKDPQQRPASAQAVADELAALVGSSPSAPHRAASATRKGLLAALAAVVAVGLLFGGWQFFRARHTEPDNAPTTEPPQRGPARDVVYQGSVDVVVWLKNDAEVRHCRLADGGILPLRNGIQFRIEAKVEPAAFLYLFWIDTEGKAIPVYPWNPGDWNSRVPAQEKPRQRLELPPRLNKAYKISGDQEGMETLFLLARPTPLPMSADKLKRLLTGLPEQRPIQHRWSAVWFENGRVVENDAGRKRSHFEVTDLNDPVLRLQERLQDRLGSLAGFTAAVSFARVKR